MDSLARGVHSLGHEPIVDDHCLVNERDLVDLDLHELVLRALLVPHRHAKHGVSDPHFEYGRLCDFPCAMLHLELHELDLKRRYADIHLELDDRQFVICLRDPRLGALTLIVIEIRRDESVHSFVEVSVHLVPLEALERHVCVLALSTIEAEAGSF